MRVIWLRLATRPDHGGAPRWPTRRRAAHLRTQRGWTGRRGHAARRHLQLLRPPAGWPDPRWQPRHREPRRALRTHGVLALSAGHHPHLSDPPGPRAHDPGRHLALLDPTKSQSRTDRQGGAAHRLRPVQERVADRHGCGSDSCRNPPSLALTARTWWPDRLSRDHPG